MSLDSIPTYGNDGAKQIKFSGYRETRGMYKIKGEKTRINADREAILGAGLGLILEIGAVAWSYFLQGNLLVALVVGISLLLISIVATVLGAALPFLFSFWGLDPALMSAPFIMTIADVFGILIYLYIARWILLF